MKIDKEMICEKCKNKSFEIKREVTYVYTYKISTYHKNIESEEEENLPFLFDNREKTNCSEYLLCMNCGEKYSCYLDDDNDLVKLTIMQQAIRADNVANPEYLG